MIHSFHIPVMGLAFTIDTPIKIAHLGISSVVSIADDFLMEKAINFYAEKFSLPVQPVNRKDIEAKATITTTYLNMMKVIVEKKWEEHIKQLVQDQGYRDDFLLLLPDTVYWQNEWQIQAGNLSENALTKWAKTQFKPGSIDVNIMTKVDKKNFNHGKELPTAYNDAHAALRGFAQSNLNSSLVLSAGMNLPLFSYIQQFDDFFPDTEGRFKKRITIKVSDFRSALVQGKMLAKKGLWVSEFRIESGLNCGGHAFPTQGNLFGPILHEFKQKRIELYNELLTIWQTELELQHKVKAPFLPEMKISAQGGVGTHQEHDFLLKHYGINSVGWGSPFLLVPEAVSIDQGTLQQLADATENDLYLSHASPLGVPFNNLRNSSKQQSQKRKIELGKPGNPCTKKFLQLNTDFGTNPICTASSKYINLAITMLNNSNLTKEQIAAEKEKLFEKECLCCGLAFPFLEEHNLDKKIEGNGVSVCPGPNIAYFDAIYSLSDMIKHIYGSKNLIKREDRPHMFIKEIQLYMAYLSEKISTIHAEPTEKAKIYLHQFIQNMKTGLEYYKALFQTELTILDLKFNVQNLLNEFNKSLDNNQSNLLEVYAR
ncbi:MAG: hypothetical protein JNJ57_08805 [Saprospiraceae bacterium]|nr:hypothetical protein [Saprospiraceae bacterium]